MKEEKRESASVRLLLRADALLQALLALVAHDESDHNKDDDTGTQTDRHTDDNGVVGGFQLGGLVARGLHLERHEFIDCVLGAVAARCGRRLVLDDNVDQVHVVVLVHEASDVEVQLTRAIRVIDELRTLLGEPHRFLGASSLVGVVLLNGLVLVHAVQRQTGATNSPCGPLLGVLQAAIERHGCVLESILQLLDVQSRLRAIRQKFLGALGIIDFARSAL
mmetsp:Transcript_26041/g.60034  ORF Transcript_26041/g.60034 Transcript_26041/m.60034 type:complete len:221 (+) Transcript_26041:34-696(+)